MSRISGNIVSRRDFRDLEAPKNVAASLEREPFVLGAAAWRSIGFEVGSPPILSDRILHRLDEVCIIDPSKRVRETHLLLLSPSLIAPVHIHSACIRAGLMEAGPRYWDRHEDFWNTESAGPSEWILIAKSGFPDISASSLRQEAVQMSNTFPGYRNARLVELYSAMALNFAQNEERLYAQHWGSSSDMSSEGRRVFCGFQGNRIVVDDGSIYSDGPDFVRAVGVFDKREA